MTLLNKFFYYNNKEDYIPNLALYSLSMFTALVNLFCDNEVLLYLLVILLVHLVQITFWYSLNTYGISLIWNALFGFVAMRHYKHKLYKRCNKNFTHLTFIALFIGIIFNFYFMFKFEAITTIAHITSLIVGSLFAIL